MGSGVWNGMECSAQTSCESNPNPHHVQCIKAITYHMQKTRARNPVQVRVIFKRLICMGAYLNALIYVCSMQLQKNTTCPHYIHVRGEGGIKRMDQGISNSNRKSLGRYKTILIMYRYFSKLETWLHVLLFIILFTAVCACSRVIWCSLVSLNQALSYYIVPYLFFCITHSWRERDHYYHYRLAML